MSHTPSTPEPKQPASATDPRYSTSGILNSRIKEKYRQGLLSTYGGRTGKAMNINKFANIKTSMRDPSAVPILEKLARMYGDVEVNASRRGVDNKNTSSSSRASKNINAYNDSVQQINNLLASYGATDKQGLTKASDAHNFDDRSLHNDNYGAKNRKDVKKSVANIGATGETFNDLEKIIKEKK